MSVRATCIDDRSVVHLRIGLNRENIETILAGGILTLPRKRGIQLSDESDIDIVFAETDEELMKKHLPPQVMAASGESRRVYRHYCITSNPDPKT